MLHLAGRGREQCRRSELQIAHFLAVRGATHCPPAYACSVAAALPAKQEAAKIAFTSKSLRLLVGRLDRHFGEACFPAAR